MSLYKKKPVTIEARQFTGSNTLDIMQWLKTNNISFTVTFSNDENVAGIIIKTLEGDMLANINDYIIKGVKGEFYPCKLDIFNETYEEILK